MLALQITCWLRNIEINCKTHHFLLLIQKRVRGFLNIIFVLEKQRAEDFVAGFGPDLQSQHKEVKISLQYAPKPTAARILLMALCKQGAKAISNSAHTHGKGSSRYLVSHRS